MLCKTIKFLEIALALFFLCFLKGMFSFYFLMAMIQNSIFFFYGNHRNLEHFCGVCSIYEYSLVDDNLWW
jgi:hypothetical protein